MHREARSSTRPLAALSTVLLALVAAGCPPGDLDNRPSDADVQADTADNGDADLDEAPPPRDADADFEDDAETDDADVEEDAEADAPGPPTPIEEMANGIDEANNIFCECNWEASGYPTLEHCLDDWITAADVRLCLRQTYLDHAADVVAYYTCAAETELGYADCLTAAACDNEASAACYESRATELEACPAVGDEIVSAFTTDLDLCVSGPPSGCPDQERGSELGLFGNTTEGLGNDRRGSCGGLAADEIHRWTAPISGTYRFETTGTEFDTVLYIMTSCTGETELGCNDDTSAGTTTSSLELELEADQSVIIVVDGWELGDDGHYILSISRL